MSLTETINLNFGRITYEPGAPKNAPRWVWRCECEQCSRLPWEETFHGPFKTRLDAERDAEQLVLLVHSTPCGTA
jgi:hypothetical protein